MKNYLVLGKFYSAMAQGMVTGEKVIKADGYDINDIGCITFFTEAANLKRHNIHTLPPPPFWLDVQEIEDSVLEQLKKDNEPQLVAEK